MDLTIRLPYTQGLERRFRAVRLNPWDVLQALRLRERGPAALFDCEGDADGGFDGLPENATVVSLHSEEVPCCFVVVLYHPSWDVVPDGERPPSLRLRRVAVVGGPDPCHVAAP
jgi:hypothetical protein